MEQPEVMERLAQLSRLVNAAIASSPEVAAYSEDCIASGLNHHIDVGISFRVTSPDDGTITASDADFLKAMRIAVD